MVRRSWWSEEAGAQKKLVLRTSRLSGEISWSEEAAGQKLVTSYGADSGGHVFLAPPKFAKILQNLAKISCVAFLC